MLKSAGLSVSCEVGVLKASTADIIKPERPQERLMTAMPEQKEMPNVVLVVTPNRAHLVSSDEPGSVHTS